MTRTRSWTFDEGRTGAADWISSPIGRPIPVNLGVGVGRGKWTGHRAADLRESGFMARTGTVKPRGARVETERDRVFARLIDEVRERFGPRAWGAARGREA